MKVHPAFLASAAVVQFTTLGMASNPILDCSGSSAAR
jgi:hypothetical protein